MDLRAVDVCIEALERSGTLVSDEAKAAALETLVSFKTTSAVLADGSSSSRHPVQTSFETYAQPIVERIRELLADRPIDDLAILSWASDAADKLAEWTEYAAVKLLESREEEGDRSFDVSGIMDLAPRLRHQADVLRAGVENLLIRHEASELVRETREARDAAQTAAGLTATASLGTYFSGYSRQERLASNLFRIGTVLTVVAGGVGILLLPGLSSGDWGGISSRIAIVGVTATLSTYFARQAGQHRRLHNWARSTQVQLDTFPAFIAPIPESEQGEAYRTLARRVLSAPPEKGVETNEDSVGAAQMLDLVTALAKRIN